jgi:C-terminal processing protease CtpA/Prc
MRAYRFPLGIFVFSVALALSLFADSRQDLNAKRREAQRMADEIADVIAKHYYDPTLHGLDWKAKLLETKKKIEIATSSSMAFANIAAMLDSLGDSHTFFIPPPRSFTLDYGWRMQTIGEQCIVVRVRPETDAATKLRPGDEILAVNDYTPTPKNLHRIEYVLNVLRPQSKVDVIVRSAAGETRSIQIAPKVFVGQSDGKSLERTGVTPDQIAIPTVSDVANQRDTVLARAAETAGAKLSPEVAASLFPYRWQEPHRFSGH